MSKCIRQPSHCSLSPWKSGTSAYFLLVPSVPGLELMIPRFAEAEVVRIEVSRLTRIKAEVG